MSRRNRAPDGTVIRRWDDLPRRLALLGTFVVIVALVRLAGLQFFREGRTPKLGLERIVAWGSLTWIASVPTVLIGVACWLLPRKGVVRHGNQRIDEPVSFRIVSRGQNAEALAETVAAARAAMAVRPLFPYVIEVVTDQAVELPAGLDVVPIVVPPTYRTVTDAKFKARALQYALEHSSLPATGWIMHLDEESHLTPGVVGGIRDFILACEADGEPRVGQGCILYHRTLKRNWLLTLADNLRTGDDVSRFYFQYRLATAAFGVHGSFILVRNDAERSVGFEFGMEGSITEDAWWALSMLERGHRFGWVDGYVIEQAPSTVKDFVRQRRRWYSGLAKVALYAPAPWWARVVLMAFMATWTVSGMGVLYTCTNLVLGLRTPTLVAWLGAGCYAWYQTMYLIGLQLNLRHYPEPLPRWRRAFYYAAQVVLMPVFGALEGAGVLYALARPERGFFVIRKPALGGGRPAPLAGSPPQPPGSLPGSAVQPT
ncbi:MAG: glycosyltransferase family 2 protein [Acidimicrobiales bacterium]|nr:glycosyltransferase family 2 protein [Acidimicrobiales bacterium]